MHHEDEAQEAVFLCRQLRKEPSLNRFFHQAANMIAVRDGDLAPDDDAGRGDEDWCPGLPLTDLQAKVCRDAAFARREVQRFLGSVAEHARQIQREKEAVTNVYH